MNDVNRDSIQARLDALSAQMAYLVEQQKKQQELFAEMSPILREVMNTATGRLDELDKKGYFAFGRELVAVGQRIIEGYTPDDVHQLGDAVVRILDTVRAMTQPEVLTIAEEASEVLQQADQAQPVGIIGMVRASRNDEVQKGMAVVLELLKHVGRGAKAVAEGHKASRTKRGAPKKARKVLGVERSASRAAPKQLPPPAGCAVPGPAKGEVAALLDGVGFTADGHLADPNEWTRELGERIAAVQNVDLGEAQWKLVEFARADFEKTGVAPNVRRITQGAGVTTKELYALFPKAPARTIAKVAGIPKPAGCI